MTSTAAPASAARDLGITRGAHRDGADRHAHLALDPLEVVARFARQVVPGSGTRRGTPPARERAPHRRAALERACARGEAAHGPALALVAHGDADLLECIEHVELGH